MQPAEKILRLPDVIALTGLSRSSIYAEISRGQFPKQVKLTGNRSVGWYETAIQEWVLSRQDIN